MKVENRNEEKKMIALAVFEKEGSAYGRLAYGAKWWAELVWDS